MNIYSSIKNKTKLLRKRPVHRFRMFLKYQFKRSEKEPIFILATRRSGSNLLLSCLNSIPEVSFASEIFNEDMVYGLRNRFISRSSVLRHIRHSINDCEHQVCGAKLLRLHMVSRRITADDLIELFPRAKFIVLYRKSLLKQYISLKVAESTDAWNWKENVKLPASIRVDRGEFESFCGLTRNFYHEILSGRRLEGRSVVLSYEELVEDAQKTFNEKIFPLMGVPPCLVSSSTIKQNTKMPEEIVDNYEQIKNLALETVDIEGGKHA